jgi:hypothetical protein
MSDKEEVPKVDDLFVMSVQSVLETAHILGLKKSTLMKLMSSAWDVDVERRKQEKAKT